MADDRLQNYVQAMEIDPASNKPIPKVVSQIEGGDGVAKLLVNADGSISVSILGADSNGGALKVILDSSNMILPVEIQSKLPKSVQTHSGVTLAINGGSNSSPFIDLDGYSTIDIHINSSLSGTTDNDVRIQWSNDGVNVLTPQTAVWDSVVTHDKKSSTEIPIKARYVSLMGRNLNATTASTFNSWIYARQ